MAFGARLRCAGRVLIALALASIAVLATSSPVRAAGTATPSGPAVRLLFETPTVGPHDPLLRVSLTRTGPAADTGATVQLTLYARLLSRSGLDAALATQGPSGPVSTTGQLSAACTAVGAQLHLALDVAQNGRTVAPSKLCGKTVPVLRLGCTAACDGVYPLRVTVGGGGTTATLDTLVTFAAPSSTPLRVAWVVRVGGQSTGLYTGLGTGLDAGVTTALTGATGALRAIARHAGVPMTVDVEGSAIASRASSATTAIAMLHAIARASRDELIAEPYVPANLGALRASDLPSEVGRQFALDDVALAAVGITAQPSPTVTYGTGVQSPTSADALATLGYRHVLVDGDALTQDPGATLSWGAAFHFTGAPSGPTALASDTELSALSDDTATDPALVASQLLGELAFLHFEQPDLVQPRAAVVLTTASPEVTTSFVDAVLAGLSGNPVLTPVSASGAFAAVPVGANGFPSVRALANGPSTPLAQSTSSDMASLRTILDALGSAVQAGGTSPIPAIEGDLLTAEQDMAPGLRKALLSHVHLLLEDQLGYFRIYAGTITLTESGATLPITLFSRAPYPVKCTLVVSSQKLEFPVHSSRSIRVAFTGSVASVRVPARALVTGDLPMTAVLYSPTGGLILAHALITVRATGTSLVGVALTALAVLVLALWWLRTSRRRRASR
jgi:hypothetical protein